MRSLVPVGQTSQVTGGSGGRSPPAAGGHGSEHLSASSPSPLHSRTPHTDNVHLETACSRGTSAWCLWQATMLLASASSGFDHADAGNSSDGPQQVQISLLWDISAPCEAWWYQFVREGAALLLQNPFPPEAKTSEKLFLFNFSPLGEMPGREVGEGFSQNHFFNEIGPYFSPSERPVSSTRGLCRCVKNFA